MMKVNSRKEILDLGEVWWEKPKKIRIFGYGIFHLDDDEYPKYFKLVESDDAHFCDNYYELKKVKKIKKTS